MVAHLSRLLQWTKEILKINIFHLLFLFGSHSQPLLIHSSASFLLNPSIHWHVPLRLLGPDVTQFSFSEHSRNPYSQILILFGASLGSWISGQDWELGRTSTIRDLFFNLLATCVVLGGTGKQYSSRLHVACKISNFLTDYFNALRFLLDKSTLPLNKVLNDLDFILKKLVQGVPLTAVFFQKHTAPKKMFLHW